MQRAAKALLLLAASARILAAQGTRDLTIVAPAAPGGGWDQTARVMQQVLRETGLARSAQVVNTAGAAGTIGLARFVSSETGNENALLVTGLVMVSGIAMNHSPVTLGDVTPVARLSGEYEVIVVPASSKFRTLADLIAAWAANPPSVSWGGGSAGGTDEILARLLAERVGIRGVNYIAYSGGGQALASVLGAHVSAAVSGLGEFGAQIRGGALRALAVSSPKRVPGWDIPTFKEQGVDLTLLNWRGVVAPPGLSREEREAVVEVLRRMAASGQWKAALARNGWEDIYIEGDAFRRFLAEETARVSAVVGKTLPPRGTSGFELFVMVGGAIALLLTAISAFRSRAGRPRTDPALPTQEPVGNGAPAPTGYRPLATLIAALLVNVALVEWAGFVLASALMFWIVARAFGSRRPFRDAVVGLALALVIHLGFTRALGVALPAGIFG